VEPFDTFNSDWRADESAATACADLFRYLDSSRLDHYSFAQLRKVTGQVNDVKLASLLQYLCSPRWNILKQVFVFFDDEDNLHELPSAEIVDYLEHGQFPHPKTGQPVTDLNQIVVAFDLGGYFGVEAA
jgi:hypothetical protein